MPDTCCAWYCSHTRNDGDSVEGLAFHVFPRLDLRRRKLWELAVRSGRRDGVWTCSVKSRLCSDHFEPWCYNDDGSINKDAFPTLFYIPTIMEEEEMIKHGYRSPDLDSPIRKRRLRKIFLELYVEEASVSMSFFVLPLCFTNISKSNATPPAATVKVAKVGGVKTVDSTWQSALEYHFYEYEDDAIFGRARNWKKHLKATAEASKAKTDGKDDEEFEPGVTNHFEIPRGVALKECATAVPLLEDLANLTTLYSFGKGQETGKLQLCKRKEVVSTRSTLADERPFIVDLSQGKPTDRHKNSKCAIVTRKLLSAKEIGRVQQAKMRVLLPKLVATDHKYNRDPRFEGCQPDQDPYQLKHKVIQLGEKLRQAERGLRKSEVKAKKLEHRLQLAEEALADYEKRENISALLPAQNLENPIAREIVLCTLRNCGTRVKLYTDLVKDFSKTLNDISPKAYAVVGHVMGLPSIRCLRKHEPKQSVALQIALSVDPNDEDGVEPLKRQGFQPSGQLDHASRLKFGKKVPLVVTLEELQELGEDLDYAEYDIKANRETVEDPDEDAYESSLLVNPPVVLGAPGQEEEPFQLSKSIPSKLASGRRVAGKKRKKSQPMHQEDDDPDYILVESDEGTSFEQARGKRAKTLTLTSHGQKAPENDPTRQDQVELQQEPEAETQYLQIEQPGLELVGQQWQQGQLATTFIQVEQENGEIQYVQAMPLDPNQPATQYINAADLRNIVDLSGYQ